MNRFSLAFMAARFTNSSSSSWSLLLPRTRAKVLALKKKYAFSKATKGFWYFSSNTPPCPSRSRFVLSMLPRCRCLGSHSSSTTRDGALSRYRIWTANFSWDLKRNPLKISWKISRSEVFPEFAYPCTRMPRCFLCTPRKKSSVTAIRTP